MTLGIMQPYFMPYLGYWQLINAVDKFVILDDVNYIKKGYINRNSILISGQANKFTLSLVKASQNTLIKDIELVADLSSRHKLLKTIEQNYKKAPFFEEVIQLLETILFYSNTNLSDYICNSIKIICTYLSINTEIVNTSSFFPKNDLKGEERILSIVEACEANQYINPIGGKDLYSKAVFLDRGIKLNFISMDEISYEQFGDDFIPYLSIIDILMFNSVDEIKRMLNQYTLI